MCGRIIQGGGELPGLQAIIGFESDRRVKDPSDYDRYRYNGAPSQDFWVVRRILKPAAMSALT